jgi:hypothetical protein
MRTLPLVRSLALIAALVMVSCGDDDSPAPTAPQTPAPAPSPPADVPSPAPLGQPVWVPPGTFACPLGPGSKDFSCGTPTLHFAEAVNAAVDKVAAERRDLFPDGDITARVRNEDPFHVAVIQVLQQQGFCAGWDLNDLQVRNSNDFAEHYDLFDARGFFHTGPADRARSTCTPADFPLSAADRFDSVRVGFYGIQCPAGVAKPPNSSGRLPVGCLGHVTATPKDKFFNDVDARIHGPYITWELEQRRGFVAMRDDEVSAFNKALRAQGTGEFRLCATVQGHRGCLEGVVTE